MRQFSKIMPYFMSLPFNWMTGLLVCMHTKDGMTTSSLLNFGRGELHSLLLPKYPNFDGLISPSLVLNDAPLSFFN
jgi:hypothetical protein